MNNTISKAMDVLKNRFIDNSANSEAFYLDKCDGTFLDLVNLHKLLGVAIYSFLEEEEASFKIDVTPFSIHKLKEAISKGGATAINEIKKIIPFFMQEDEDTVLACHSEKEIFDATNKLYKKYNDIYASLEECLINIKDQASQNKKLFGAEELYIGYPFGAR